MEEFSEKLFKTDSKGKVRVLHVWTLNGELNQESGLLLGSKVLHTKTCKIKNAGKSNETTAQEQAIAQAISKVAEKLKEGYFLTEEEAKTIEVVMPMLALSYNDEKSKIKWDNPVYISPKMDGMRCHIVVENGIVTLISRAGKEIITLQHIKDAIKPIISSTSKFILDGECYYHGSFQENMRLIKKVRPGETEKVCFVMYDIVSTKPYIERYNFAKLIVEKCKSDVIKLVETIQIDSETDLIIHHKDWLSKGFEGSMLRHGPDDGYSSNKRSKYLLKYKDFQDIALPIHDVVPSDAIPEHGQFIFYQKGAKGHAYGDDYIGCGMKFSHEERKEMLLNKDQYVNKIAELRYFEKSESGILRFPICIGIRLDK